MTTATGTAAATPPRRSWRGRCLGAGAASLTAGMAVAALQLVTAEPEHQSLPLFLAAALNWTALAAAVAAFVWLPAAAVIDVRTSGRPRRRLALYVLTGALLGGVLFLLLAHGPSAPDLLGLSLAAAVGATASAVGATVSRCDPPQLLATVACLPLALLALMGAYHVAVITWQAVGP